MSIQQGQAVTRNKLRWTAFPRLRSSKTAALGITRKLTMYLPLITKYFAIPVALTLGIECYVSVSRGVDAVDIGRFLSGGFYYTLPFALWAMVVSVINLSNAVSHSGFIGCTLSLALVSAFWLFPPDPSGLPMQWMLYWPLSAVLVLLGAILTAIWRRVSGS